jgi:hypothetical protein
MEDSKTEVLMQVKVLPPIGNGEAYNLPSLKG